MVIPSDIKTYLAWTFSAVLPGTFKRNKKGLTHHDYPILAPLPARESSTRPLEDCERGPFIYFVVDRAGTIAYIGKSQEDHVLVRWMRPGAGGPSDYYWTHSTPRGGCVFEIARGIHEGNGPYNLRYAALGSLILAYGARFGIREGVAPKEALIMMENGLKSLLKPSWNIH